MYQILLVEEAMKPVPANINVVQNYGEERLFVDPPEHIHELANTKVVHGEAMLVTGEPEAFQQWLKPFPGVWITNNPMMGNWRVVHVKDVGQESVQHKS